MKDLSFLAADLRAAAIYTKGGREVMWPRHRVQEVINSLADSGFVVLGLDLRSDGDGTTPVGLATEIPWSVYRSGSTATPEAVEAAKAEALLALRRPNMEEFDDYRWVLVTW